MRQEQIKILAERCRLFFLRTEPDLLRDAIPCQAEFVVHVSIESKNSLDLNTVRNNVKMVRF